MLSNARRTAMPANALDAVTPAKAAGYVIPAQAPDIVTPAKAGVQELSTNWIPAFAGMTAFKACARVTDVETFAGVTACKSMHGDHARPRFQ
jgi:hypothetical protein